MDPGHPTYECIDKCEKDSGGCLTGECGPLDCYCYPDYASTASAKIGKDSKESIPNYNDDNNIIIFFYQFVQNFPCEMPEDLKNLTVCYLPL